MKGRVQVRDVEADDLPLFFAHQRDPIAVALVAFRSRDRAAFDQHWEKLLVDDSCLKKTIVADGQVAGNIWELAVGRKRAIGYWIDALSGAAASRPNASPLSCAWQTRPLHAGVATPQRGLDPRPEKMRVGSSSRRRSFACSPAARRLTALTAPASLFEPKKTSRVAA